MKILYFKEGQTILKEGETTREAYIIDEGTVAVVKNNQTIATLGPNELFGEIGWLEHLPRTATIVAISDVTLNVIRAEDAPLLMENNPKALIPILKIVCNRLQSLLEHMGKV